jgi:hypothetical protein
MPCTDALPAFIISSEQVIVQRRSEGYYHDSPFFRSSTHQNKHQVIKHEDKNAVFHFTRAIHVRFIVCDKI